MTSIEYNLIKLMPENMISIETSIRLAKYIIDNNITIIPRNLTNNHTIYEYLLVNEYPKLSECNFNTDVFYEEINKNRLAEYIMKYGLSTKFKELIKNDYLLYEAIINHGITLEHIDISLSEIFNPDIINRIPLETRTTFITKTTKLESIDTDLIDNDPKSIITIIRSIKDKGEKTKLVSNILKNSPPEVRSKLIKTFITTIWVDLNPDNLDEYGLTMSEIADVVVSYKLVSSIDKDIRESEELYRELLNRNYKELLGGLAYHHLPQKYIDIYIDRLSDIFISNIQYQDTIMCNFTIDKIIVYLINNNMINDKTIPVIGSYIAKYPYQFIDVTTNGFKQILNDIRIFNYVYDEDIEFLFELDFSKEVLSEVPKEKIDSYNKRHPKPEVNTLRNAILAYNRYSVTTPILDGIANEIINSLHELSENEVYDKFINQFEYFETYLLLSKENLLELLANIKKYHGKYNQELIDLFRKLKSTMKEQIAISETNRIIDNIKNNYAVNDEEKIDEIIKKRYRYSMYHKYLYYLLNSDLTNINASKEEWEVFTLLKQELEEYATTYNEDIRNLLAKFIYDDLDLILPIPNGYKTYKNRKNINRLHQNYTKLFQKIITNNPEYQKEITEFLSDRLEYSELKKYLDKHDLSVLQEIKTIAKSSGIIIIVDDNNITFAIENTLSDSDIKTIKEYEKQVTIIKKIKLLIHKHMDMSYPLKSITISDKESDEYWLDGEDVPLKVSPRKSSDYVDKYYKFMKIRNSYTNPVHLAYFDKLFIDNNFIYAIYPILDNERKNKKFNLETEKTFLEIANNIPIIADYFKLEDLTLDKIGKKKKLIFMRKYCREHERQILGTDVAFKIISDESFMNDVSDEKRISRIKNAAKYVALASSNYKSTVPYIKSETDGITVSRYDNNDPSVLISGIETDSCFKLSGNDNDFMLYTIFDKNGFNLKLTDSTGALLGRVSGFRNGNAVYFNQLRTINDISSKQDKSITIFTDSIRKALEDYANELIRVTSNTKNPIEYIFITQSYGYSNCSYLPKVNKTVISKEPMELKSSDYASFKTNPDLEFRDKSTTDGFSTDFSQNIDYETLLLATSNKNHIINGGYIDIKTSDLRSENMEPIYERVRKSVDTYDKDSITEEVIDRINTINAKYVYWGNFEKREEKVNNYQRITKSDIVYAIIGEDFYITIDSNNEINGICLPYDNRAEAIYQKYFNMVTSMHQENKEEINKTKKR